MESMKNILIYVNPKKQFDKETKVTIKIQIDNSLELGWNKNNIILVTNFPYEYRGIKALVVNDKNFYTDIPISTKTNVITALFKQHFFKDNELYWVHDLDAFQLEPILGEDIEMQMGNADLALTDYGRMIRWSTGSIFFKKSAEDIFDLVKNVKYYYKITEENALMVVTTNNVYWAKLPSKLIGDRFFSAKMPANMHRRVKKLNKTYNFSWMNLRGCYAIADKPLKVIHFHPIKSVHNVRVAKPDMLDFFIRGKNKMNIQLISDRLLKIFKNYGIK